MTFTEGNRARQEYWNANFPLEGSFPLRRSDYPPFLSITSFSIFLLDI